MRNFRKLKAVQTGDNKIELVPYEQTMVQLGGEIETEAKKGNAIRQHAFERQRKLLLVILQLAKSNLYSDDLSIKLKNGDHLNSNQFINLLNYSLSPGKAITGIQDFVEILFEAKVTPEMLINENVKTLLRDVYAKNKGYSIARQGSSSYTPGNDNKNLTTNAQDSATYEPPSVSLSNSLQDSSSYEPTPNNLSTVNQASSFYQPSSTNLSNESQESSSYEPPAMKLSKSNQSSTTYKPSRGPLGFAKQGSSTYKEPSRKKFSMSSQGSTDYVPHQGEIYRDTYKKGSTPPPPEIERIDEALEEPIQENEMPLVTSRKRGIDAIKEFELRPREPRYLLRSKRSKPDQLGSGWEDFDSDDE